MGNIMDTAAIQAVDIGSHDPIAASPALHAAAAETDVDDPLAQLEDRERTGTPSGPGAKKKEGDGSGNEAEADVTMDPGEEEDDEDNDDYYQASAALMRGDE